MSDSALTVFGQVAGIGGLALGVLLLLYREVLRRRIFPQLSREQGYRIIRLIIVLTWTVAIIGIASWVYTSTREPPTVPRGGNWSPYGPPLPFNTGWIFVGYYDANRRVFIEGPTSTVAFRPTGAERGGVVPEIGDVLRVRKPRRVIIAAYRTSGLKHQLTSPPLVNDITNADDETGVELPEGAFVIVRDVEISGYPGRASSVWARVAACDDQTESCRRARSEAR
jgi:hypothetical protein